MRERDLRAGKLVERAQLVLRQRFGRDGLVQFGKSLLKVALYGAVLGTTLADAHVEVASTAAW